jgi:dipeptidyl aminopeptidase/acylaminoacyl peptidase
MKSYFCMRFCAVSLIVAALFLLPISVGRLAPEDILQMEQLGHFALSPDGDSLVYIKTLGTDLAPPEGNGTLMHIDLQNGTEDAISSPTESVTSYALSPDGSAVAYAAVPRAGGNSTLALVSLADRRINRLQNVPEDLFDGFFWLGEDRLVFAGKPEMPSENALPGDVIVVDERPDPVILKAYSLRDETVVPLSSNLDVITIYAPSPDGRYILYKASVDPESWQAGATFRYALLDAGTGREKELLTLVEGYQDENQIVWSPDSSTVYIERMHNGGINYPVKYISGLLAYSPVSGALEEVPLSWDFGLHSDLFNAGIEVSPFKGGAYVLLANGTNPRLARYLRNETGWQRSLIDGIHEGNIFALETNSTGSMVVYNYNSASTPPQLFSARVRGESLTDPVQLTHLNAHLLERPLGDAEITTWKGARNDTITGIVRYPPGYMQGKQYPLVLVIHGGPNYTDFDSWRDTWEFPYHLITDKGAVTLSVNYHGSMNFGFDFAQSIEGGHYYDLPVEDIQTGVEHLAAKGVINPSQVGVTGWSNGGILTLALITRDRTFKAAVAGAGTADENSQIANTNGIVMDKMYYNRTPYQDPESFRRIIPLYHASRVQTPLLMMEGTDDDEVVPASAWVTYRAFKEGSHAPVRFVLFKGQPHHPQTYQDQLRKVLEELGWLDRYILSPSS